MVLDFDQVLPSGERRAFKAFWALLPPARLYSVRDFRFYRGEPPLQPTPLPARLSTLPANPLGDYHAIRVP